jgi:threonine dehydratase
MTVRVADVVAARSRIASQAQRTPLVPSRSLGERTGAIAWLKLESLQRTGSFKVRGAANAIALLTPGQRAAGVVTMSAGNAALAIAYAAGAAGVPATVAMPERATAMKIAATRAYGAEIRFGAAVTELMPIVRGLEDEGRYFLHPFDDERMIAGFGTVALEILDDLPDADLFVVPVGGGGLISGIATVVAARRPSARVIGVEPVGAPGMRRALDAGRVITLDAVDTIAEGLAPPFAGAHTLEIVQRLVSDVVAIPDEAIREGLRFLFERARVVAEASGAAAVAALLSGAVRPRPGERVVAIVSGGNVDLDRYRELLAR